MISFDCKNITNEPNPIHQHQHKKATKIPCKILKKPKMSALNRAEQWRHLDPNQATKDYVTNLLDDIADPKNAESINSLFPDARIGFGTAGLRSAMKPGPMGMNDLVVIQAAQGEHLDQSLQDAANAVNAAFRTSDSHNDGKFATSSPGSYPHDDSLPLV